MASNDVFKKCGCRDENGKQYGANCPQLEDREHGTWAYYLSAGTDPKTGKRRQHRKGGFPNKRAAQIALNKVRVSVDEGTYTEPSRKLVGDYAAEWLPRREKTGNGLKPTTYRNYDRYIRNDIKPSALGRMKISEVRRFHVNDFTQDLVEAERGPVTVRRILAVLKVVFAAALRDELIATNPAQFADLPTVEKAEFEPWEPSQVDEFLKATEHYRLGVVFETAIYTGLRRGELAALRWEDVDLERRTLTVKRNRVDAGKVYEYTAKSAAGRRTIPLPDAAVGALMAWQINQQSEAEEWAEASEHDGYVFTLENGRPLAPGYLSRQFQKVRETAGLPAMKLHGTRHEFASLLIAAGVDIAVVSKLLGHASVSITSDIYGHLIGSVSRDAMESAASLIQGTAPTLHKQDVSEGTKNAPAEPESGSDKGIYSSLLPDSNRRPAVYKTAALAS